MFLSVTVLVEFCFMRFVFPSFSGLRLALTRVCEAKQCRATTALSATAATIVVTRTTTGARTDAIAAMIVTGTVTAVTIAVATFVMIGVTDLTVRIGCRTTVHGM